MNSLSTNAIKVLEKRYLAKDENGELIEKPVDLFNRVAAAVAEADLLYDEKADIKSAQQEFFDMMTNLEFLPNSPTLMNAGRPLGQLSACFVLPIGDSMEEIFETIKNAAIIHKSGGGTGFSFSKIRPKGAAVNSTGGVASGPVSFMKVYNSATEAVKQGGTRRGANMGILRVDHPDILEFISCKEDNSEITNFNISVGINEEFMKAVESGKSYDLIDPHQKTVVGQLNASEVFAKIVESAWKNGEPGIIFLDRINDANPVPSVGEIESTNPCGEQPLLPYESCNLGSINLSIMTKKETGVEAVDYDRLKTTVWSAVHFLDNVIDINKYPLELIEKTTKDTRKIGLGVMGFADLLYKLNIPYNSDLAINLAEDVMSFIQKEAKDASIELARVRGAFPLYDSSIFRSGRKVRNATVTTIAPTGTLSIIAGTSSGIEPVFGLAFIRNVMDNTELVETNPVFKEKMQGENLYSDELMKKIASGSGLHDMNEIPARLKRIFVTAHDISPLWHIKMQAAFQKYTDNAVSKTVNFPNEATTAQVAEVFMHAYKLHCKGVTIYRDGSRDMQVLNLGNTKEQPTPPVFRPIEPRPRPVVTSGVTEKAKIGCGNLYITVNYDEYGICEVFTNTGRAGGCPSQSEATSRLVSIALRSGVDAKSLVEQLKGIRCPSTIRQHGLKATSCPDAIGRVIEKVIKLQGERGYKSSTLSDSSDSSDVPCNANCLDCGMKFSCNNFNPQGIICPECGSVLEHEGGCVTCRNCGFSKCG